MTVKMSSRPSCPLPGLASIILDERHEGSTKKSTVEEDCGLAGSRRWDSSHRSCRRTKQTTYADLITSVMEDLDHCLWRRCTTYRRGPATATGSVSAAAGSASAAAGSVSAVPGFVSAVSGCFSCAGSVSAVPDSVSVFRHVAATTGLHAS